MPSISTRLNTKNHPCPISTCGVIAKTYFYYNSQKHLDSEIYFFLHDNSGAQAAEPTNPAVVYDAVCMTIRARWSHIRLSTKMRSKWCTHVLGKAHINNQHEQARTL